MLLTTAIINAALSLCISHGDKESDSAEARVATGLSMMETVYDRFHINYEMSRTHKVGYYKESMSDMESIYYLADGIVDIYVPCNLNQFENALISPIKTRKQAFKEVTEENLLLGNASDMARSSIWRPNSFLNEKNRYQYIFSYAGDTSLYNSDVSIILFEPGKSGGQAKGKIYVDKSSYAIVKIDYKPIVNRSKYWSQVSWSEEFQFRNGAYELSKVMFQGVSEDSQFQYSALLVMDQVEVLSSIPEMDSFISDNTSLFERAEENFSDGFWEGYDFLKHHLQ